MNRAVFLDRDGTITKRTDLITKIEEIELEEGAADGIKLMNDLGLKVIVITNQPQIARGLCTEEDVHVINKEMIHKLKKHGADIDAVYFCPHHPEQHPDVPEHAKKYRMECDCRKPKTGLINQAAGDFDLDLQNSFFIGDRTVDVKAGENAGCSTILVRTGEMGKDGKYVVDADYEADNLLEAAKIIEAKVKSKIKAVILAGGRGERLIHLTKDIPKPMIKIAGKPVLEHQIDIMKSQGIKEFVLCGSYLVDKIKDYFGDGSEFGIKIYYPNEPKPLGSGGAIKNASEFLSDANYFIILNGDVMIDSNFDFNAMVDFHKRKGGLVTLLVRETDHPKDSDIINIDQNQKLIEFIGRGQDTHKTANVGVIIANHELLDHIPIGINNIEKDVIFKMVNREKIYAFNKPENWYIKDMGTPERLAAVREHFEKKS